MVDQPNLSREGLEKLEFVGRQGDQLVYKGANQKMIMLDVDTVNRLGMPIRSRKRNRPAKYAEEDVWSGSRSSQTQDRQATAKLIEILKNYQVQGVLFANKKMRKKEVWMEIAGKLMAAGFHFHNKETAWEKVSQKWRNMERTYRMHINNIRAKGSTEGCRSMEFFEQLHELLSCKYKTGSVLPDHGVNYHCDDGDDSQMEMMNGDYEYEEEEEEEEQYEQTIVTAEPGPNLMQADMCYDTYVENELPPSPTFSDNKNLVFASVLPDGNPIAVDPNTAEVRDPVVRLLLEMRAQERAHFREDRRERLRMQKEAQDFRRDLVNMLNQQHQERMEVMQNLAAAISGALGGPSTNNDKLNHIPNGEKKGASLNSSRHNNLS